MNANRYLSSMAALLAATICFGTAAHGQVVIAKGRHSKTILQNSSTPINLVSDSNPLDTPTMFICKSPKGCVALMTVTYVLNEIASNVVVCAAVDGVGGNPTCAGQSRGLF